MSSRRLVRPFRLQLGLPSIHDLAVDSLNIYRRLLRATTYLPDSFARIYVHDEIVSSFKKHHKDNRLRQGAKQIEVGSTRHRLVVKRVKDARSKAQLLERAGEGSIEDLKNVLFFVHGRKGKRKRELVNDLIRPSDESINAAIEELYDGPVKQVLEFVPGPKFDAFLKSQQTNPPLEHPKYKIKHLSPSIPKKNLWDRPMPQRRQQNLRKRWWAYTLDKLLPPVPRTEWDRLKALATGSQKETPPPRRTRISTGVGHATELAVGELTGSIRQIYSVVDSFEYNSGNGVLIRKEEAFEKNPRQFTSRSLQRLYASIWNMTATMSQNTETGEWNIEWGKQRTSALDGEFTKPSQSDKELFIGPDSLERPERKIDVLRMEITKIPTKEDKNEFR